MDILVYLGACALMGLGIAIDVALASIALGAALRDRRRARQWVTRITATHITFPMIGYYSAFTLEQVPGLSAVVGVVGASLIAIFLYGMLRDMIAGEGGRPPTVTGVSDWPLVLAVSWDALWSGPAKAAQAMGWTAIEVLLSFPLAGLVVAAAATVSTLAAGYLETRALQLRDSAQRQVAFKMWGVITEVGIFSYFGFLALFSFTIRVASPVYVSAVAAFFVMAALKLVAGQRIAARMAVSTPHP